jgi:hypothetical protein
MKKLFILIVSLFVFFGSEARAAGDSFFHITDTHVADDSNHVGQLTNLTNWVNTANKLQDQVGFSINTGDLADFVSKKSDLEVYFNQVARLIKSHFYIPGNHDYQTSNGVTYGTLGYENYGVSETTNWYFVGSPPANTVAIDWVKLEANLAANKGRKNIALLSHYPFNTPSWLLCNGGPCNTSKWILTEDNSSKFRNLMDKYDVNTVLSGHVHAHYQMIDKTSQFDQLSAGDLEKANALSLVSEYEGRLFSGFAKAWNVFITIVSPGPYDGDSGFGKIYEPGPVKVKVVTDKEVSEVSYKIGSYGTYGSMSLNSEGLYEANYDWNKLSKNSWNYVYVKVKTKDGTLREVKQAIQVAGEYPNKVPSVNITSSQGVGVTSMMNISVGYTDDGADTTAGVLYIDGIKKAGWTWSGGNKTSSNSYVWYTGKENSGEHIVVYKTSDKFGRRTYSAKQNIVIGTTYPSVTPEPTVTPEPSVTPEPTITTTPIPSIGVTLPTPTPSMGCETGTTGTIVIGQTGQKDSYIFNVAKADDTTPWLSKILKVSATYPQYRAIEWFDLTQIPQGAKIISAELKIFINSWYQNNGNPIYKIAPLGKVFDESVNWEKANQSRSWTVKGAKQANDDYWGTPVINYQLTNWGSNTVDVKSIISYWIEENHDNAGMLFWEDDGRSASFYSSEYLDDVTKTPVLTVSYKCQ